MNDTLSFYGRMFSDWDTMAVILKPYFMQKNLFELYTLTDSGDAKASGISTCTKALALVPSSLAPESPGETFSIFFNFFSFTCSPMALFKCRVIKSSRSL